MTSQINNRDEYTKEEEEYLVWAINRFLETGWEGEGPNSNLFYRHDEMLKTLESENLYDTAPVTNDPQDPVSDSEPIRFDHKDDLIGSATLEFLESHSAIALTPSTTSADGRASPRDEIISLEYASLCPGRQDQDQDLLITSSPVSASASVITIDPSDQKNSASSAISSVPSSSVVSIETDKPNDSLTIAESAVAVTTAPQPTAGNVDFSQIPAPDAAVLKSFTYTTGNSCVKTGKLPPAEAGSKHAPKRTPKRAPKKQKSTSTQFVDHSKIPKTSLVASPDKSLSITPTLRKLAPAALNDFRHVITPSGMAGVQIQTPYKTQKQVATPTSSIMGTPRQHVVSAATSIPKPSQATPSKVMPLNLPPTPQSQTLSKKAAPPIGMEHIVPIEPFDASIHDLQGSYNTKLQNAKIEHQNKLGQQAQQPQRVQPVDSSLFSPQQLKKFDEYQERLNRFTVVLREENERIIEVRDSIGKLPIEVQAEKRETLDEQYERYKVKCDGHQKRVLEFRGFQQRAAMEQKQKQAIPKVQIAPQHQVWANPHPMATQYQNAPQHNNAIQYQGAPLYQLNPQYQNIPQQQNTPQGQVQVTPQQPGTQPMATQHQNAPQHSSALQYQGAPMYQFNPQYQTIGQQQNTPQCQVQAAPQQPGIPQLMVAQYQNAPQFPTISQQQQYQIQAVPQQHNTSQPMGAHYQNGLQHQNAIQYQVTPQFQAIPQQQNAPQHQFQAAHYQNAVQYQDVPQQQGNPQPMSAQYQAASHYQRVPLYEVPTLPDSLDQNASFATLAVTSPQSISFSSPVLTRKRGFDSMNSSIPSEQVVATPGAPNQESVDASGDYISVDGLTSKRFKYALK